MRELSAEQFQKMLLAAARAVIDGEPRLTEIDTVIGDGDHGVGMKRGFTAVERLLTARRYDSFQELARAVSLELIRTMGGASGVIFGTMFFGGIAALPDGPAAGTEQLAAYFLQGEAAVEKRGRSHPGQKTMLDALYPACAAFQKAAEEGEDVSACFRRGWQGAEDGMERSKALRARVGRSKNFREETIGLPDPGAVSVSLIWRAFRDTLENQE